MGVSKRLFKREKTSYSLKEDREGVRWSRPIVQRKTIGPCWNLIPATEALPTSHQS